MDGGEDWRRDDDFDLSWQNPPQAHAPIAGAAVRVTGPGGFDRTTFHPGSGRSSIDDLTVPAPGDYTASVYLRDAAGNESLASAGVVHLRFDDTVPARSQPDAAQGWLSRAEVVAGYRQGWSVAPPAERPPSGIAGYRVIVNRNSDTDPCSGADDQRACGGPITEAGADNAARVLGAADLAEGENFVHVAAVSGSGMRSTQVGHARVPVDLSDPAVELRGDGGGEWMDHDANLQAVASDAVSGMADTGEFPADAPPRTVLTVDEQVHQDTDANVSATLSAEGAHQVSYFAQDLAGNTNDGFAGNRSPSNATVRIDKTAPAVAFTNAQDPDDPDRLVAPVADSLSGVADGRISYRQAGGGEWKGLETALREGDLTARVDSGDLRPGVTYEFRAIATDRAGNGATSTSKVNGEPMRVTGPFRTLTGVVDLAVNGKRRAKVGYRRPATVTGSLVGSEGRGAVAGAAVTLTEKFLQGSRRRIRTSTVTTNSSGAFAAKLRHGPSRKVVASYAGDRRFLGTVSAPAKLGVRSRVSLRVDPTASASGRSVFSGRIRAKGARFGKAGKRLEVQVRVGGGWRAVGKSFRTDRSGRYRLAYEFSGAYEQPVTYRFRAAVLRQRGLPYLRSTSRERSVTVRP